MRSFTVVPHCPLTLRPHNAPLYDPQTDTSFETTLRGGGDAVGCEWTLLCSKSCRFAIVPSEMTVVTLRRMTKWIKIKLFKASLPRVHTKRNVYIWLLLSFEQYFSFHATQSLNVASLVYNCGSNVTNKQFSFSQTSSQTTSSSSWRLVDMA